MLTPGQAIVKYAKIILYNTIFVAVLYAVCQTIDWHVVRVTWRHLSLPHSVVASLVFIVFYLLQAAAWRLLLQLYSREQLPVRTSISYMACQAFKYLPTSIFTFSFRLYYARKQGVRLLVAGRAVVAESLFQVGTSLLLFVMFWSWSTGILLLAAILFFCNLFLRHWSRLNEDWILHRFLPAGHGAAKSIIASSLLYLISWVIAGLALYVFAIAIQPVSPWTVITFQALSYGIGIAAFFAPGGLGVKEYILSTSGLSEGVFVNWRVLTIVIDLIASIVGILVIEIQSRAAIRKSSRQA